MRVRHKGGNKEIVRGGRDDSGYLDDSGAEGNCCGAEGNSSHVHGWHGPTTWHLPRVHT